MIDVKTLLEKNLINETDYYYALHFFDTREVQALSAIISANTRAGHICTGVNGGILNEYEELKSIFNKSTLEHIALNNTKYVGNPGEFKPIIFDGARFYLHRYYEYETFIIDNVLTRSLMFKSRDEIALHIPEKEQNSSEINYQDIAIFMGLRNNISFITGGPGTGKTTTVAKILHHNLIQNDAMTFALTAPTGKAAARLKDSIISYFKGIDFYNPNVEAMTIHRLLGYSPFSHTFKYSRAHEKEHNPLLNDFDLIIVDEASMIDISLMFHLLKALPLNTRIIFLGDKNQLASVAPGSVFGDICDIAQPGCFTTDFAEDYRYFFNQKLPTSTTSTPLQNNIVELRKSYRYPEESNIAKLATMTKNGETDKLQAFLSTHKNYGSDVKFFNFEGFHDLFKDTLLPHYKSLSTCLDLSDAFALLDKFQILTVTKQGKHSSSVLNRFILDKLRRTLQLPAFAEYFHGLPLLITRNDYINLLFNGDMGIIIIDSSTKDFIAAFENQDVGGYRYFNVRNIYGYDYAYCMTVHKSQGSEFENIILVLPEKPDYITRELIYTAITRARKTVYIIGDTDNLIKGIMKRTFRLSGIKEKLG